MEGGQVRNSGWKKSMIKDGQRDSRIMENSRVDKDLPSKFSPSRNIEVNPKLFARSNILSRSDDSFRIDKDRSMSRDGVNKQFKGISSTPKAESPLFKLTFNNLNSLTQLDKPSLSPSKNVQFLSNNSTNSADFLHQIKLEYLRFKDKVMKELKKMEKEIRTAIEQVMSIVEVNSSKFAGPRLNKTCSVESRFFPTPAQYSQVKILGKLPKLDLNQEAPPSVDTSKYRQILTGSTTIQSVLPKIKERMGKFFDLMGQMKSQINSQNIYSPAGTKTGQFGNI